MSKAVDPHDAKPDSGRELTNSNPFPFRRSSEKENPQTLPFKTGRSQNRLRPEIWAGAFWSRDFREGPCAWLPLWKNGRPAYSNPWNGRLA